MEEYVEIAEHVVHNPRLNEYLFLHNSVLNCFVELDGQYEERIIYVKKREFFGVCALAFGDINIAKDLIELDKFDRLLKISKVAAKDVDIYHVQDDIEEESIGCRSRHCRAQWDPKGGAQRLRHWCLASEFVFVVLVCLFCFVMFG